ncbi:MAG: CapA family protein [Chloroflexota bacterium]|nr:CapA family protein [Chloroflexota bacterium]
MQRGDIDLLVCGDINIQHRSEPESVFALVKDELRKADVRLGNCEMCLSSPRDCIPAKRPLPDEPPWLQSDARMAEALVAAGFDLVTTANNVTFGASAIIESLQTLDRNGIPHTGSGASIAEARRPAILTTRNGTRLGLLGYTCVYYPLDHAATEKEPGVAVLKCHTAYEPHPRANELPGAPPTVRSWPDPEQLDAVKADVKSLRPEVDILVTYFHMGVSSQDELCEYQRHIGRAMVDAGVDLVFGSSAHKPQAIEIYQGKPIFYGMGNFAFDWSFLRERRHGLLARFEISGGAVKRVSFRPVTRTRNDANQVQILSASSAEGREIVERVAELSKGFGTRLTTEEDGTVTVTAAA